MGVAHDAVSQVLSATACFILIYLATFETSFIVVFPAFLLITGIVLQIYFSRRLEYVDHLAESAPSITYYTLVALAGFAVASVLAPALARGPRAMELTGIDAVLYAVLIAVAEEQFFRGALMNMIEGFTHSPIAAVAGSSTVFMVYHFGVYGTRADALIYVFFGGLVLAWVAWRSGRLSPAMLAHMLNNFMAFVVVLR